MNKEMLRQELCGLLDKPMVAACGDVKGLRVLDCGCSEGRFCRMLAGGGASYVLGIDLCEQMIQAALEIRSEGQEYFVADAENLDFLEEDSLF